jgi:hypothetical protein
MKYILFIILVFVGKNLIAQSANPDRGNNAVRIESSFTKQKLSSVELAGFERRAKEKLGELGDYINLMADPNSPAQWRAQAYTVALAAFENPKIEISGFSSKKPQTAKTFLEQLKTSKNGYKWSISQIQTEQAATGSDGNYRGSLIFQLQQTGERKAAAFRIEFVVSKVEKIFGSSRQSVWEVQLGKISRRP